MMSATKRQGTEELIRGLGHELKPVTPLRPPITRALLWLAVVAVLAAPLLWWLADSSQFRQRFGEPRFALELAATLLTGVGAIVAAFHLAIPGRSERWMYAPLAPLLLWLGTSGLGCLNNGVGAIDMTCLMFMLVASVPLSLLLFALLRRAKPIEPLRVATMAGLGVAGVAAFLLQFFHPFDITVIDLAIHAAAVAIILLMATTAGRRVLATAHA
jgi:hypothetical protein